MQTSALFKIHSSYSDLILSLKATNNIAQRESLGEREIIIPSPKVTNKNVVFVVARFQRAARHQNPTQRFSLGYVVGRRWRL